MILTVKFAWLAKEALKAAGVNYSEGLVFESKYRYDDGYDRALSFFKSNCSDCDSGDELAAGLLNGLLIMKFQYQKTLKSLQVMILKSLALLDQAYNHRTTLV